MPFDQAPQPRKRKRERVFVFAIPAMDLKTVIVDAALAGVISQRDAEDLIIEYGLRHE